MDAQPVLNNLIKAPAFAGRSINFFDDIAVVAHDYIATSVDRTM